MNNKAMLDTGLRRLFEEARGDSDKPTWKFVEEAEKIIELFCKDNNIYQVPDYVATEYENIIREVKLSE